VRFGNHSSVLDELLQWMLLESNLIRDFMAVTFSVELGIGCEKLTFLLKAAILREFQSKWLPFREGFLAFLLTSCSCIV